MSRSLKYDSIFLSTNIHTSESAVALYVGLGHAVPPTNTKLKPVLLPTQGGMPYTNTHKHRTSYFKSTLTFIGPAKRWKSLSAARQKPEIFAVLHHQYNNNNKISFLFQFKRDFSALREQILTKFISIRSYSPEVCAFWYSYYIY